MPLDSRVNCVASVLRRFFANPGEYLFVPPCHIVLQRNRLTLEPLLEWLEIVALASMSDADSGCEGNDSSHRCGDGRSRVEHVAHLSHGREVQWMTRVVSLNTKVVGLAIGGVGHGRMLVILLFEIVASVSSASRSYRCGDIRMCRL